MTSRPVPEGFPPGVVLPDYAGFSIVGVPLVIERALAQSDVETPLLEEIPASSFDRVVLLVLDGFGYRALQKLRRSGDIPVLDRLIDRGTLLPITSVFPSTTVTALTSLVTGLTPGAHGMIGYRLYLREISGITDMIRLELVGAAKSTSAEEAGLDLDQLVPRPTFCERLTAQGISIHVLLPRAITRSGLSRVLYRGCTETHSMEGFADMCGRARQILQSSAGSALLTLYWPGLDSIAHIQGPDTDAYRAEAMAVDAVLGHELVGRADRTLLLITSDHGFVSMAPTDYMQLSALGDVADELVRLPVGEPRASYLHLKNGTRSHVEDVEVLRDGLIRLGRDRVLSSGLLGEDATHPEIVHRVGDVAIISTGAAGVYHPYPDAPRLRGMHGGLTEQEMLVPLIVAPL